jgi:hypothetical protein
MSKPMENKTPEMIEALENMFPGMKAAIADKKCPSCEKPIGTFRNAISIKEYAISGLCQECQDSIWGKGEEDHDA